jgi:16S rRNA (cytosine1402-N4)-methyltransferase
MNYEPIHVSVLLKETLDMLGIKEDGTYVDATVGLGGHAAGILSRITKGRLIGIDRDEHALKYAHERLGNDRVFLKQGRFSELKEMLMSMNIKEVDGVLFDLGVSMKQLKEFSRGFSFLSDAKLDMRMDTAQRITAWDIVNTYSEKDIERILREYGEEPFARRIAKAIITHRKKSPINTCKELADIVVKAYGKRGKIHPATRTFQALRIEVNREIDELRCGLSSALSVLKAGGRLCVISYHSLEDRFVKNFMRESAKEGILRILTKKPVMACSDEIRKNPSSRSAKLRGAEKISSQGDKGIRRG